MEVINAIFLGLLVLFLFLKFKPKSNKIQHTLEEKPDDLFSDGLDHNMGLKKNNRHHSF